jgi:ATP-dependent helicase/nuclease subunit B
MNLHTLESLATLVFKNTFSDRKIVEGPVRTLLLNNAVQSQWQELRFFGLRGRDAQLPTGTFEKLLNGITNLKQSGVYPEVLMEEIGSAGSDEQEMLRDMVEIYKEYENQLESLSAVDVAGIFKMLHRNCTDSRFEGTFRHLFPDADSVIVAGFDEFTEPEIRFLRKICAVSGISMMLLFDFSPGNPSLFGHLEENYRRFRQLGFTDISSEVSEESISIAVPELLQPPSVRSATRHIARTLFDRSSAPRLDLSEYITLVKTGNRADEVTAICRIIKQILTVHPGQDLSRIAVVTYRPDPYTDIMREIFPRYGIPVNITDRFELSRSPLVVSVLGLLQILTNGFRRDDVLRMARSPYFTFPANSPGIDFGNLVSVSSRLKITAGYRTWIGRIDSRQLVLESRPEDRGDSGDPGGEITLLRKARHDIDLLWGLLRDFAGEFSAREFQRKLGKLLEAVDVSSRLLERNVSFPPDLLEKDARAYGRFLEVLEETVNLLEFQEGSASRHPLKFFLRNLRIALLKQRYNLREQYGHGVLVTSIEETRGLPIDVMILAGLVDSEFPSVYQPEIFYDLQRRQRRQIRHVWESRYLFYQAITNWRSHLYLTYPQREGDCDLVRSGFIDALLATADVEVWNSPHDAPSGDDILSEDELLNHCGLHGSYTGAGDESLPALIGERIDEIARTVAVEQSRFGTHTLPEFEGFVFGQLSEEGRQRLASLRERTYSVSQLETYGKCPFRFFAQRLLALSALPEYAEELTPLEKGSVLHEALFEFYVSRRARGLPSLPQCSERQYEEAVRELVQVTEAKLARVEIPDAFWDIEKELILGRPGEGSGLLHSFLDGERRRTAVTEPRYFEAWFGVTARERPKADEFLSREGPLVAGRVKLRGKVDRVEVGKDCFTVVDYKTGRGVARIEDIREGLSLQLPVYLYAVEELLEKEIGASLAPAAGLYYQLREPVKIQLGLGSGEFRGKAFEASTGSRQMMKTTKDLRAVIAAAIEKINQYVDDIALGKFPLTSPEKVEKVCSNCEFKAICRIQTVRYVEHTNSEDA